MSSDDRPIFLCYRQIDGKRHARWLYETLKEYLESVNESTSVYFDQTAPATADWHCVHGDALERARALIVICSPGLCADQGPNDWVHREIDWWLGYRKEFPILVDITGQGERWVPEKLRNRWPDAQRINIDPELWRHATSEELAVIKSHVCEQIRHGVTQSAIGVVQEDLARTRTLYKRLWNSVLILVCLLLVASVATVIAFREYRRAQSAERVAVAKHTEARRATAAAQVETRVATSQKFAALSRNIGDNRPILSALLAREAVLATVRAREPALPVSQQALRNQLARVGGIGLRQPPLSTSDIAVSPNGRWLASACVDGTVYVWDCADLSIAPRQLKGHGGAITHLEFIDHGKTLLVAATDGTMRAWNFIPTGAGTAYSEVREAGGTLYGLWVSGDGMWMVTAATKAGMEQFNGGNVLLWDLSKGWEASSPKRLAGHNRTISATFSPDSQWLVTYSFVDYACKLWDLRSGAPLDRVISEAVDSNRHLGILVENSRFDDVDVFYQPSSLPTTVAFSPNGKWMAIPSSTGGIDLWSRALEGTWKLFSSLSVPDSRLFASNHTFSPDGRWFVASGLDSAVYVWPFAIDGPSPSARQLKGHRLSRFHFAFSPDSELLISTNEDRTARIWKLSATTGSFSSTPIGIYASPQGWQPQCRFSADGRYFVLLNDENWVHLVRKGDQAIPRGHDAPVKNLEITPDGRWLITVGADRSIRVWDTNSDYPASSLTILPGTLANDRSNAANNSAFVTSRFRSQLVPDNRILFVECDIRGQVTTSTAIATRPDPRYGAALATDSEEKFVILGSEDGVLRVWNAAKLRTESEAEALVLPANRDRFGLFAIGGNILVSANRNNEADVWNLDAMDPPRPSCVLSGHNGLLTSVAVSADAQYVMTASENVARLWTLDGPGNGRLLGELKGHESAITLTRFDANCRFAVTAGTDHTVLLWTLSKEDSQEMTPTVLRGHLDRILDLSFSRSGRWLATGSQDGTVRVWDLNALDTHVEPYVLQVERSGVLNVQFSPDERWIAAVGSGGSIQLWPVTVAGLRESPVVLPTAVSVRPTTKPPLVVFSPDSRWLLVGGSYPGIHATLWDIGENTVAGTPSLVLDEAVSTARFGRDGRWMATLTPSGVYVWDLSSDLATQQPLHANTRAIEMEFLGWNENRQTFAFISIASQRELIADTDDRFYVWNADANSSLQNPITLNGAGNFTRLIAIGVNEQWCITEHQQKNAFLWDLQSNPPRQSPIVLPDGTERLNLASAFGAGNWAFIGTTDGGGYIWSLSDSQKPTPMELFRGVDAPGKILKGMVSPNGGWIVVLFRTKKAENVVMAELWNIASGRPSARTSLGVVASDATLGDLNIFFSPDDHWLAVSTPTAQVNLWDLKATKDPSSAFTRLSLGQDDMNANPTLPVRVLFASNGRWMIGKRLFGGGSEVVLWDLNSTDKKSYALSGHQSYVNFLATSSDGRWLATGSYDNTVRLWRLDKQDPPQDSVLLSGHKNSITSMEISSNDSWIGTCSRDGTANLWKLSASNPAQTRLTLSPKLGQLSALAFSPDEKWLATAGMDFTQVGLWSLDAKNPIDSLIILPWPEALVGQARANSPYSVSLNRLGFSKDSRLLHASVLGVGKVCVWDLHDNDVLDATERIVGRDLTVLERDEFDSGRTLVAQPRVSDRPDEGTSE